MNCVYPYGVLGLRNSNTDHGGVRPFCILNLILLLD